MIAPGLGASAERDDAARPSAETIEVKPNGTIVRAADD
jgi:hypothetical protein